MESHIYPVDLNWIANREGEVFSPDLEERISVATPPEFPKGMAGIWSPEHLFTAAVSSCFMTTFLAIAENSQLEFTDFSCPAKGKLEKVEGRFVMSEIALEPQLNILHEEDRDKAERILQKAEKACLISNSITSKVILTTHIEVLSEAV